MIHDPTDASVAMDDDGRLMVPVVILTTPPANPEAPTMAELAAGVPCGWAHQPKVGGS